ncbi:hypothetical protein [Herbaspirillum aquaticum]|uniref:hypothetical protein n=1 Tax=Herbaspirillum aquaticum TaxID=568783 RepID=UPI0024DEBAF7|nr:hypothetical protein [Herbaspirillum aquaticum]
MSVLKIWLGWFCAAFMPLYFGGESSSDSSTTATTTTTNNVSSEDKRIVGGDGSTAVSGSGNSVIVTDSGAVQAALSVSGAVANKAIDGAQANVASVLTALTTLGQNNQASFDKTIALVGTSVDKTQEAFKAATEEVNGNRALVAVGIIAIGMMAAKGAYK